MGQENFIFWNGRILKSIEIRKNQQKLLKHWCENLMDQMWTRVSYSIPHFPIRVSVSYELVTYVKNYNIVFQILLILDVWNCPQKILVPWMTSRQFKLFSLFLFLAFSECHPREWSIFYTSWPRSSRRKTRNFEMQYHLLIVSWSHYGTWHQVTLKFRFLICSGWGGKR